MKSHVSLGDQVVNDEAGAGVTVNIPFPDRFQKGFVDSITNFDPEINKAEISLSDFRVEGAGSFRVANGFRSAKKISRTEVDFIYDYKEGWLFFNENGSAKGFGDGGLCAIFDSAPFLTASNFTFV